MGHVASTACLCYARMQTWAPLICFIGWGYSRPHASPLAGRQRMRHVYARAGTGGSSAQTSHGRVRARPPEEVVGGSQPGACQISRSLTSRRPIDGIRMSRSGRIRSGLGR